MVRKESPASLLAFVPLTLLFEFLIHPYTQLICALRSRIEDRGSRIEDRGSRIEDRGSRIKDRGSNEGCDLLTSIFYLRSSIFDPRFAGDLNFAARLEFVHAVNHDQLIGGEAGFNRSVVSFYCAEGYR